MARSKSFNVSKTPPKFGTYDSGHLCVDKHLENESARDGARAGRASTKTCDAVWLAYLVLGLVLALWLLGY